MNHIKDTLNKIRERVDSGSYGQKYGMKETADDYMKIVHAQLWGDVPSEYTTVADKEAWVRRQPAWKEAVKRKGNAYADWKTAETYVKLSFAEFDMWRSEEATNRGLDRRSTG